MRGINPLVLSLFIVLFSGMAALSGCDQAGLPGTTIMEPVSLTASYVDGMNSSETSWEPIVYLGPVPASGQFLAHNQWCTFEMRVWRDGNFDDISNYDVVWMTPDGDIHAPSQSFHLPYIGGGGSIDWHINAMVYDPRDASSSSATTNFHISASYGQYCLL